MKNLRIFQSQLEYFTPLPLTKLQHTVQEQATFESKYIPHFYVYLLKKERTDQHTTYMNKPTLMIIIYFRNCIKCARITSNQIW